MEWMEKGAALSGVWVVEQCRRSAFQTLTLGGREPGVLEVGDSRPGEAGLDMARLGNGALVSLARLHGWQALQ